MVTKWSFCHIWSLHLTESIQSLYWNYSDHGKWFFLEKELAIYHALSVLHLLTMMLSHCGWHCERSVLKLAVNIILWGKYLWCICHECKTIPLPPYNWLLIIFLTCLVSISTQSFSHLKLNHDTAPTLTQTALFSFCNLGFCSFSLRILIVFLNPLWYNYNAQCYSHDINVTHVFIDTVTPSPARWLQQ